MFKEYGIILEDIREFIQDGSYVSSSALDGTLVSNRVRILSEHLSRMEHQRRELDNVIQITKEKISFYNATAHRHASSTENTEQSRIDGEQEALP